MYNTSTSTTTTTTTLPRLDWSVNPCCFAAVAVRVWLSKSAVRAMERSTVSTYTHACITTIAHHAHTQTPLSLLVCQGWPLLLLLLLLVSLETGCRQKRPHQQNTGMHLKWPARYAVTICALLVSMLRLVNMLAIHGWYCWGDGYSVFWDPYCIRRILCSCQIDPTILRP